MSSEEEVGVTSEESRLVNCSFSVNKAALDVAVRPLVAEAVLDLQLAERLSSLEADLRRLQVLSDAKADATQAQATDGLLQACVEELQLKATQKAMTEAMSRIAVMEEAVFRKAELVSLQEVAEETRKANTLIAQKADLSQTSLMVGKMNRMQVQVQQQEKLLTQVADAVQALEGHHLPQLVQRTKEQVTRNTAAVRSLQESIATKAPATRLDDFWLEMKEMRKSLSLKANAASLQELISEVYGQRTILDQKAEHGALLEVAGRIQSFSQAVETKATRQELQHVSANLQASEQALGQKADLKQIMEAKQRMLAMEATLEEKALARDVSSVMASVATLQDCIAKKADRHAAAGSASELTESIASLRVSIESKAEATSLSEFEVSLEKLKGDVRGLSTMLTEGQNQMASCLKIVEELRSGLLPRDKQRSDLPQSAPADEEADVGPCMDGKTPSSKSQGLKQSRA
eukprot:CAMPEP_0178440528 /NCGR_PEP_ID=MMETSP0689_2-20121128/36842_1 /TAXON_ID=160604 /ORGANISM="Amphidinium massartii, Strain CS-259" /LENGTH=461 /DNA_ID=CAMNT_0020063339 /DNA_START=41 /DNA_END=1426 /DNA_ORIENTATION=+